MISFQGKLYDNRTAVQCTKLNESRGGMPSLQFYHSGVAMENYCSARSYATRCSDYNTFCIPRQGMPSNVVDNSTQSHNWLADSGKVNDRRNDLFPINQGQITSTTAKQRSSVIKWARKDVPFETAGYNQIPFAYEQSLQTINVKYQEKSLESILYKEKDLSSGKTFTQNAFPSNKTDIFQPCSSNTKKYKYNCRFCGKPFQWYSHWQAHERIHTGERPYSCDECGKAFTRSDGLQSHKITHLNKMNSRSPEEKTKITDETKRAENKLIPYDEFVGEVNDEEMFGPKIIRDNDKNLFHCRFCKRVLFSSAQFLKHVHHHKGKYIFKCNICDKAFPKRSALEIHNRTHTGARPYQCNTCTKTFTIYGNLKRHLIIHTGEKPYTCSKCSSSFNNPSHLSRHMKNKHEGVCSV